MHVRPQLSPEHWGWEPTEGFRNEWETEITETTFLGPQQLNVLVQNFSKVTFMASSIFHVDVLHHHLIKCLLLEIYGLLFFSRYDAKSQMFAFAEKLHPAWLQDNTGNINQFLTFCGLRSFLLLYHGQYSAPVTRNPQILGLLVMIRVRCVNSVLMGSSGVCPTVLFISVWNYLRPSLWWLVCAKPIRVKHALEKNLHWKNLRYIWDFFSDSPVLILFLSLLVNYLSTNSKMLLTILFTLF